MGFMDIIDLVFDSIKKFFNLEQDFFYKEQDFLKNTVEVNDNEGFLGGGEDVKSTSGFDLDLFIKYKLLFDLFKFDD